YPTEQNLPILPTAGQREAHQEARAAQDAAPDPDEDAEQDADASTANDDGASPAGATVADDGAPAGADGGLDQVGAIDAALAALSAVPRSLGEGDGIGSNSWVIGGEHTDTGMPLLANDPHLGASAPGIWYQVGLHCVEVSGECP